MTTTLTAEETKTYEIRTPCTPLYVGLEESQDREEGAKDEDKKAEDISAWGCWLAVCGQPCLITSVKLAKLGLDAWGHVLLTAGRGHRNCQRCAQQVFGCGLISLSSLEEAVSYL